MKPSETIPITPNSPIDYVNYTTTTNSCQENTSLDKRTISENYSFKVFPNCVEYTPKKGAFPHKHFRCAPRGDIQIFSKKSRFRLFHLMAKINNQLITKPLFITLTYHHGHHKVHSNTKGQLHHFLVMLRQFDPDVQYIWRIELQKRGAPHYHLIILPGKQDKQYIQNHYDCVVADLWHKIADPNSRAHKEYGCKVKEITSYRDACAYISKYVGKYDPDEDPVKVGRHWGNSRKLPFKVESTISMNREEAEKLIEIIRKWLFDCGKGQYADTAYFNIYRPQVVFISSDKFAQIRGSDKIDLMVEQCEELFHA